MLQQCASMRESVAASLVAGFDHSPCAEHEAIVSCAGVFDCKPLPVLWARIPEYTADNTIMFDDLRRNYVFNPQNGLVIRPYKWVLTHA